MDSKRFYNVYVGTYGSAEEEAIQILQFDSENGSLEKIGGQHGIENPSFLTVNKNQDLLYAISEADPGIVTSYRLDASRGSLIELNHQNTQSPGPCYVSLDPNEVTLLTANYGGGSVSVFPLDSDGTILNLSDIREHDGSETKKSPHPHQIKNIPNTDNYLVTDLGLDKLYLYRLYNQSLKLIKEIETVHGSGPRHLAVNDVHKKVYVANEFNSKISVYSYDKSLESFDLVQEVDTILDGFNGDNYGADIHLSPSGSHLYVSNRGHHSITTYKIDGDGILMPIGLTATLGEWPRNFAVVPDEKYLLVANEHTSNIDVMKLGKDGVPEKPDYSFPINKPVCLHVSPRKNQ